MKRTNWNYIMGFTPTTARNVLKYEFPDHFFKLIKSKTEIAYDVYLLKPAPEDIESVQEMVNYFRRNFKGGKQYIFHYAD